MSKISGRALEYAGGRGFGGMLVDTEREEAYIKGATEECRVLNNYLNTLKSQSFKGWSEQVKQGYLTAIISFQSKIMEEIL